MNEQYNELITYLNNTPQVLSLLYDLDLLPEQLAKGSKDWHRMVKLLYYCKNTLNIERSNNV